VKIPNVSEFGILENKSETECKTSKGKRRTFGTFSHKSTEGKRMEDPEINSG
jgi:hypothetical protein